MRENGIGWWHAISAGGTEHGLSDNNIAAFGGTDMIANYVKEIVQNSLDAKDPDSNEPVRVVFTIDKISTKDPVVKCVHENIKLCKEYWDGKGNWRMDEFAQEADCLFDEDYITILIASDYNTTGIPGAWNAQDRSGTPWAAMAECEGYSNKPSETSGGSWGIGKTVAIAISRLNTFFCNSYCLDEVKRGEEVKREDVRAFTGICKIASFKDEKGDMHENVGRYRYNDADAKIWRPIWEKDHDPFAEKFHRNEYGTDIISLGFNEEEGWEIEAAFGVVRGFFPAVLEDKLTVTIKGSHETIEINKNTIESVVERLKNTRNDRTAKETYGMFEAFKNSDITYKITINEKEDAILYVKATDKWITGYGGFRANGMFIRFFERRGSARKYCAVFMVKNKDLDSRLRDMEPPEHNKWDPAYAGESIKKVEEAKALLATVKNRVCEKIDDFVRVDTTDVLDAYGMAKYLPGEESDEPGDKTGKDILNPKFKISHKKTEKKPLSNIKMQGKEDVGKKSDIDAETNEQSGDTPVKPKHKPHIPTTFINDEKEGDTKGVARVKHGGKLIKLTGDKILYLRTYALQKGKRYRTAIGFTESHSKVYFSFFSRGEDGRENKLGVNSFYHNGKQIKVKGNTVGPVCVEANEKYLFEHSFKTDGLFRVKVVVEEEVL